MMEPLVIRLRLLLACMEILRHNAAVQAVWRLLFR